MAVGFTLQTRAMAARSAIGLVARLLLINAFALDWVQFNVVASALIVGLDALGAGIVEAAGGGPPTGGFAAAFGTVMFNFAKRSNAMTENMGGMGGAVATGVGMTMMGLVRALAGGVLIFSRIMLTLLIGIAPVMIGTLPFDASKGCVQRWLSLLVGLAMYPLVIAGVMATVIGMPEGMAATLGDPAEDATLGAPLPFFAMVVLAAGMIGVILPRANALGRLRHAGHQFGAGRRPGERGAGRARRRRLDGAPWHGRALQRAGLPGPRPRGQPRRHHNPDGRDQRRRPGQRLPRARAW